MNERIKTILTQHSISYRTFNGRLQACDTYTIRRNGVVRAGRSWVTVDGWRLGELMAWLGY